MGWKTTFAYRISINNDPGIDYAERVRTGENGILHVDAVALAIKSGVKPVVHLGKR